VPVAYPLIRWSNSLKLAEPFFGPNASHAIGKGNVEKFTK